MKPSRDIERLVEIMAALRDPKTGCPWDMEQTFRSIVPYTIEETYEVVDAIERDDREDMRDELGDLLLQVIYYAQMAREEGSFDFGDIVEGVTRKMIRRHPHVFGDERARNAGMATDVWERIKAEEKADRVSKRASLGLPPEHPKDRFLDAVPSALPASMEALKLQNKAAKVGFDWNDPRAVIAKLREEADELENALQSDADEAVEDEIGDLFFVLVNLARHRAVDPDQALRQTNRKFRRRFAHIEAMLKADGRTLEDAKLDEMEALWQDAKRDER